MSNILIVGANGQVGRNVVRLLKEHNDHKPVAFVRKDEQVVDFENDGVEARLGNLEDTIEDIAKRMDDIDGIVFTAGSGGSTGADKTVAIDLDGAVKVAEAAKQRGINRFVIVSAYKADDRNSWADSEIKYYYAAKYYADLFLENSGLDYTIVKPGLLTNDDATGNIQVIETGGDDPEDKEITRADVARVIIESLDNDNSINKALNFVNGETPIADVINQL